MDNTVKLNYENVNLDFTDFPVLVKGNVFEKDWQQITLFQALNLCQTEKYKELRKRLSASLYRTDPNCGYWNTDFDLVRIELKNNRQYKEIRRKESIIVKYFPLKHIGSKNGIVVLDVDFKVYKSLYLDQVNNYKSLILDYFKMHDASVFIAESASGLGFHIGMSFHAESIDKKKYQKAYEFYVQEMVGKIGIRNLRSLVDFSVAHVDAEFFIGNCFIGWNGEMLFKNPSQSLNVIIEESENIVESTNDYTIESYRADFLLQHYFSNIPEDCKAFSDYKTWVNMTIALVVTFQTNKERAYFWFKKLSFLSDKNKINEDENDIIFERIFESQLNADIGINYIFKQIFEAGYAKKYITYSFEEVKNYFESNHLDLSLIDPLITNDYAEKYVIEKYISERSDVLQGDKNLLLIAPPNSGKSHFYLTRQQKTIFLTPTSILRDDLWSNNSDSFKIVAEIDIERDHITYVGNYDSIFKIVGSGLNLKEYTLVIDESHELFFSSHPNFRYRTMRKLVNSLSRFKNFVLLTGTPFQFELSEDQFETYYFTKTASRAPLLEVVSTLTPLDTMAKEILEAPGKQICFINDKALISKVEQLIKDQQPDRNILVFTSETKTEDKQQLALQMNLLPESTVVLGTQMILQGISFKDQDISHLRFYQPIIAEYIAQFSFRPRDENNPPKMVMYTKPKDYRIQESSFPLKAYDYLKRKYNVTLENILQNGIENEPIGLIEEGYYRRLIDIEKTKSQELLPIIHFQNIGYEIDKLFLGQLAIDLANKKSSIDLFSLLIQLLKWNFNFSFRQCESTEVLKLQTKKSKAKQFEVITYHFKELVLYNEVRPEQNWLFRAWAFSKVITPSYFLNLSAENRLNFFADDKLFKGAVLKVAVWARQNELNNPYLNELINRLRLEQLIQFVLIVSAKNTGELVSHEVLMGWLDLPQNKIKETKSKLKLYFEISNVNKNSTRAINIRNGDLSIIDSIMVNEFEEDTSSPF